MKRTGGEPDVIDYDKITGEYVFYDCSSESPKVFEFGNKRVKKHFENINGFLAHKKMESLRDIEK